MQAADVMHQKTSGVSEMTNTQNRMFYRSSKPGGDARETIHSGHFMVSDFEAEAQDDEDELAVPVPEEEEAPKVAIISPATYPIRKFISPFTKDANSSQLNIETSLNKLFQCMSLAYRQKLTSPKWNRFKGIRLRWKDKIRLNNVIWRCWHLQFILKQNTLVCQFASPLDVDTHNKPEAVVLEGKYWKRKLAAVTAEYKKWRMFYRNKSYGLLHKDGHEMLESMDMFDWPRDLVSSESFGAAGNSFGGNNGVSSGDIHNMMVDEDYMELMTDTLFSTITSNQPIYFPDPREIARGANLADFIQPSLGPLQPNLDDFMDTLEPLQEFFNAKLPSVPEEDDVFRSGQLSNNYADLDIISSMNQTNQVNDHPPPIVNQKQNVNLSNLEYTGKMYTQQDSPNVFKNNVNTVDNNFRSSGAASFEGTMAVTGTQIIRDKGSGKSPGKAARSTSYSSTQQQPNIYQTSAQHQNLNFQQTSQPAQNQRQSYAINVQSVPLLPVSNPLQIVTLNEQPNVNNITKITTELIEPTQTYVQSSSQQKVLKPALPTLSLVKPYKVQQSHQQQGYKYPAPASNFANTQFKFGNNELKNKHHGIDLTAPATMKLLPRHSVPSVNRDEVFAVPKMNYQMKSRSRSRSSSSLTSQKVQTPHLMSAVSDPSLNINNNALLAHLLTNNTPNMYTPVNNTAGKVSPGLNQATNVKHILPMITHESSTVQLSNPARNNSAPMNVQSNIQPATLTSQAQRQQVIQASAGTQVLLNTNNQTHQSQSNPNSPKESSSTAHSPQSLSISPLHSPMSIGSPLSPTRGFGKGDLDRGQYKEQRRVGHIHAEQKRRYNIKNGFDMLHSLIPALSQNPNAKLSKAAMLQKGAEYIKQLKIERNNLKEEMETLRHQIECLNASISNCQLMLPATGAPVSRSRTNKMKEMFDEYVRVRTRENWKFWIFSILLEPLMTSFNSYVSTKSIEDLCKTTLSWVEQHCSLVDLRPAVLNSLKYLCTATDILTNPDRLQEEALAAISQPEQQNS